jgi:hypothetical protein
MCDHLSDETAKWHGRTPPWNGRAASGARLLDRYKERLAELTEPA